MDLPAAIDKYWTHATALALAAWAVIKLRLEQRARVRTEEATLQAARQAAKLDLTKLAHEAAADVVKILRDEVDRLAEELGDVRRQMQDLQGEHIRMIADKDAEITLLRAKIRQLESENDALKRAAAAGERPPLPFQAVEVTAGHQVKPMGAPE